VPAFNPTVFTDTVSEEGVLPEPAESFNQLPPDEVLKVAVQSMSGPLVLIVSCWDAGLFPVNVSDEVPSCRLGGGLTVNDTITVWGAAPGAETVTAAL
jgi:hypothetical protein